MARIKSSSSLSEKHQMMMEFEEKHFQNQQHLPYYNDDMSTNITCLYHTELNGDPALVRVKRPTTRRNPSEVPPPSNIIVKPRPPFNKHTPYPKTVNTTCTKKSNNNVDQKSHSSSRNSSCCSVDKKRIIQTSSRTPSGSVSARSDSKKNTPTKNSRRSASLSSRSETQVETNVMETNTVSSPTSPQKKNGKDNRRNNKMEEHEYLLFLLRVTEDIIMNNYYANEDIDRVFKEHMDINKDRLMKEKMEQHLARLADELHINDVQTSFETEKCTPLSKPAYTNIQTLKSCQCECAPDVPLDMYLYPTEEYNYYNQTYKNNLDEIIYYRHSLGRLTEYTEPTNSSTTVTKAISSCPTKSNNMLLENIELDGSKFKIYDTRSEVFNIKGNDSEDSLCPTKFLRSAISENVVHQKDFDENTENEINKDRLSKKVREKSLRLNNTQNIGVIEEDKNFCDEDKDCDQEKKVSSVDEITQNTDKFKCFKSTSEISNKTDSVTIISVICDDSIEKINAGTYKSDVNTDKEEYNTESNPCLSESNSKTYKSDFSTESTEKYDLIGKFKTKRSKSHQEKITITNSVTRKGSTTTEYSGFATEVNSQSSDINSDKFDEPTEKTAPPTASRPHTRSKFIIGQGNEEEVGEKEIGDFDTGSKKSNSDKNIAEKGDFKSEKSDVTIENYESKGINDFTAQKVDKCSITDFHLELLNVSTEVRNCEMRLNLDFAKDSIESMIPSPYIETSKSKEAKLPLEMDFAVHDSKEFKSYTVIPSPPREIDKSVQTSCSKLCATEKPKTHNKSVQMSCTYSSIACCTEDDHDVKANNSDYILITSPVYILKSALNSGTKIIIEKDKFIEPEQEIDHLEDIEERSDIDSEAKSIDLKLLGSDYDLMPERDTTNKPHFYLSADTSVSHVGIPSLSSIQEDRLLLGNLYELHDDSNENLELGSATYRCMDTVKALSCDDDIFLRNSEVVVNQNWLSDKGEMPRPSQKKRVNKLKHVRASVNVSNSTSSASLTC